MMKPISIYLFSLCLCGINNVLRTADTCRDDLGLNVMNSEDLSNIGDKIHAVVGDIVKSAYKGAYVCSSCASSHKSLRCAEDKRNVCLDALC